MPKIGLNVYAKAELDLLPQDVVVQISQPQSGSTLDGREGITLNARVEGDPQLRLLAGVDFTLRDGSVEEPNCPLPGTERLGRQTGNTCFRGPSDRHYFDRIRGSSRVKSLNTIIMPDANARVANDVAQINQGQGWTRIENDFKSNTVPRIYTVIQPKKTNIPPELAPNSDGEIDFFPMERGAYKAFTILKKFKAGESQENMDLAMNEINQNKGITTSHSQRALQVYQLGLSRGGRP